MNKKASPKVKPGTKKKKVQFNFYFPDAERVFLAGDFNNWDVVSLPMKKTDDGSWRPLSTWRPEGTNTVSGQIRPGMMTPMLMKWLRILLETKIASEL